MRILSEEDFRDEIKILVLENGILCFCPQHGSGEKSTKVFRIDAGRIVAEDRVTAVSVPILEVTWDRSEMSIWSTPEEILADGVLPEEETVFLCPPQDEAFDERLSEIYQIFEARALIGICTRFWAWLDGIAYEGYQAIVKPGADVEASGSREV